jgi:phage tail-like protein
MTNPSDQSQVISAARFYIDFPGTLGRIAFSELGGINSKVNAQDYTYNDDKGITRITKQYGKTDPPTITLRRGLDRAGTAKLMEWHAMARLGKKEARVLGSLVVTDASGSGDVQIKYDLHGAWCSELNVTNMKAGSSEVAMLECKITCEFIGVEGVKLE